MNGTLPALLGGLLGLVIGSFLGTLVERWPKGEQVVRGRSRCASCGAAIRGLGLFPVFGYALRRGRCRACGEAIPAVLPVLELTAAAIGALAVDAAAAPAQLLWALFGWILLALAVLDLRHFWLPDRLTLPLAAFGLIYGVATGAPAASLLGAGSGWALLVLIGGAYERIRKRRGLGGGDAKLFGAIGAWTGPSPLPFLLLFASLAGLFYVLVLKLKGAKVTRHKRLPLGTLLALAAGIVIMWKGPASLPEMLPGF